MDKIEPGKTVSLPSRLEDNKSTIAKSPGSTIRQTHKLIRQGRVATKVAKSSAGSGAPAALTIEDLLGEGGMATVHLATQQSIGRRVAVKRLTKSLQGNEEFRSSLLREGWLMATLEHPNIPPVHDVLVDETGSPTIVLKRIQGDEWSKLIDDAQTVSERYHESLLPWNLSVLDNVCNAISYAHSKDVVHRDLKPDNIMIGAFGEVYVLDWGIAAALCRDPDDRLPYIGDSEQPVGTPCFMAPELLAENPENVGVHTDIYLIGAMLYQVLTGHPPHLCEDAEKIIESILRSDPQFPQHAPEFLVAVCRKAMRPNPDDRFGSVEELRQTLRSYLRRREAEILLQEALGRLDRLRALASTSCNEERGTTMSALYSECSFAFKQVLLSLPGESLPEKGLAEAAQIMARCALSEGRLDAASAFLDTIPNPESQLSEELEAAHASERVRRAKLESFERDQDTKLGMGKVVALCSGIAFLVTGGAFIAEYLRGTSFDTHLVFGAWQTILLLEFLFVYPYLRFALTQQIRLVKALILTGLVGSIIATMGSWLAALSTNTTVLLLALTYSYCTLAATFMMGLKYLPSSLASVAAVIIIALFPTTGHLVLAAYLDILVLNVGLAHLLARRIRTGPQ